jgi:hypothetical protein
MLKKLILFVLIVLIPIAGGYFYFFADKRTLIKPYPYLVLDHKILDLAKAENAKVLIIGDRMGKTLDKELAFLEESTKLTYYNWSKPKEGLHRTLYKLRSLKKIPSIIIYHGASEEFYEKKFLVSEKAIIEKNFSTYENDKLISLIMTFPILSKVLYENIRYIDLAEIKENKELYSAEDKLNQKQIAFHLFSEEIKDLIEFAHQKKSKLIFITTPLNNSIEPKEVCAHATTSSIKEMQNEITKLIELGQFKEAYVNAQKLAEITTGNALSFYLLGRAAYGAGDTVNARIAYMKASAFDCMNWRGNAVFNSIMISEGQKHQVPVIDFNLQINATETSDKKFFDDIYPQNIFYQSLAKELGETIHLFSAAIR